MNVQQPWILPDGVDELLPEPAAQLEFLRRQLLTLFDSWGYDLVFPPLVEFVDSLAVGAGQDLTIQTYQVIDHLSGRLMGFRPDITAQAARMDARHMSHIPVNRLCYCGSIVLARSAALQAKRAQVQAGVELFGHLGLESDLEVMDLMLNSVHVAGFDDVLLDIGHAGLIETVFRALKLPASARSVLLDILSRKSRPDLEVFLQQGIVPVDKRSVCRALLDLHGPRAVLDRAMHVLASELPDVAEPLKEMMAVADQLSQWHPHVDYYFDVGELRGLDYHTGLIFAVYDRSSGRVLAKGGRYDGVGEAFGRARPAIGFSMDLLRLVELGSISCVKCGAILAPCRDDEALTALVQQLRLSGERVVVELPGVAEAPVELNADRRIVCVNGQWEIQLIDGETDS